MVTQTSVKRLNQRLQKTVAEARKIALTSHSYPALRAVCAGILGHATEWRARLEKVARETSAKDTPTLFDEQRGCCL